MKIAKLVLALSLGIATFNLPITQVKAESLVGESDLTDKGTKAPAAWGVTPTPEQYRYQKEELAAFMHFGPNTFNEIEWGEHYGNKTPDEIFKLEEDFDAETLVKAIRDAGFKKLIVTAKHHDGFCIWNSAYTDYDVAATSYKNGEGDILAEVSAACTKYDIDMGLYLSPWDIHAPEYGYHDENGNPTTPDKDVLDYNDYYVNQLNEILGDDKYGNNGHFTEIWMDGAKGSGANAQEYDHERWYNTIQNQEGIPAGFDSECMIFQCGANTTVRWIGNETGYAAKNTWSKSNVDITKDSCDDNVKGIYSYGFEDGNKWTVPEADARITDGWFWGTKKKTPKSITDLGNMYFGSVGHNAPLLLNIPPNNQGKVDEEILQRVKEFGDNIEETFQTNLAAAEGAEVKATSVRGNDLAYRPANVVDGDDATYWTTDDGTNTGSLIIDLGGNKVFDVVSVEEAIQFGQSINEYKIEYRSGVQDGWKLLDEGETIGAKRLARTSAIRASQIRITVSTNKTDALPIISEVGVYKASDNFELAGTAPAGMDVIDIEDKDISDGAGFTMSGKWNAETGNNYVGGTNEWANAGASFETTFHGSKIYLIGTKDPNHGKATITIDGKNSVTIDTNAVSRATGQFIYTSPDLEDGDHTLRLTVDTKAIGIESAYVINNGGVGMIGLEKNSYTMNENEKMDVKVIRVGGSKGAISATLHPNPGSAIQDDFNTELIPEIIMKDGETEAYAAVETRRNTNITGDRMFTVEITNPSENLILGFYDKATITIKDTETSSVKGLEELIEEGKTYKKDWYVTGWDDFADSLAHAQDIADQETATSAEVEQAINSLRSAMDALVKRVNYSAKDRFQMPWKPGSSSLLEAEFAEIVNDPSNDKGWPCVIAEGAWASNGKYVDAINEGDKLKVYYTAEKAGTYHAVLSYESGSKTNAIAWSEENGKIESGSVSAGADKVGTTHTAEFDIVVKEAGDGVLVFTGPAGKSPRMDCIAIIPSDIAISEFHINASAGTGGSISDAGTSTVLEGESKTYTITANEGYEIKDVLVNGVSVGARSTYTFAAVTADADIEAIFAFAHYTDEQPFVFPVTSEPVTLEAEYAKLFNTGTNETWPLQISEADWASNGKFVNCLNTNDWIEIPYTASTPGTYEVTVTYRSGDPKNALVWTEKNDKIESNTVIAGASDSAKATHTVDFELVVKEAGAGILIFTGPDRNSPQLDKFEIALKEQISVDTAALESLINQVKVLDEQDYTAESWNEVQKMLEVAEDLLVSESATQEQIDQAVSDLQTALDQLEDVEQEDTTFVKAILKNTIDKASALKNTEAFGKLNVLVQEMINTRLHEAEIVYADENAVKADILDAWMNLADALHYAQFTADKSDLKTLIDECAAIDVAEYDIGVDEFLAAFAKAKEVYSDDTVLQETIDQAYTALLQAKAGLDKKPAETVNKDALKYLIDVAKEAVKNADRYQVEDANWDAFLTALEEAKAVYADEKAGQAQVNEAVTKLAGAYENIRLLPDEELLAQIEDFLQIAQNIDRTLYSKENLDYIDEAITAAMNAKNGLTEEEKEVLLTQLGNALKIIEDDKLVIHPNEDPKPEDQEPDANKGEQTGTATRPQVGADTGDTTNVNGMLGIVVLAGGILVVLADKRRRQVK